MNRTLPASTLILSPLKTVSFLLGGIAVAIVLTGCSPAEQKKSEAEWQRVTVDSTAPTTTETGSAMSPKETFMKMLPEYDRVGTMDDLEALFSKYGTTAGVAEWKEGRAEMEAYGMPKAAWDDSAKSVASRFKGVTSIQERISGGTAIVTFIQSGEELYLAFTLENGQWKARSVDVVGAKWGYPPEITSP